ncbi:hypothetical protein [Pantoea sp. OXWO6B1]|uniref:hypothetical protein n=1 Tax=Pantoea TaxID=53335 RepID=UPI0012E8BDCA|nr:hypothetical protein [Pantoea sp. OXWO6B1]
MFDLIKIVVTFLLSGCVGVFITYRFQKKQFQNQYFFKKAEMKAIELKEVRNSFEALASERIYRSKTLINSFREGKTNDSEIESYISSVVNWNTKLNRLYFDLNSQQLSSLANVIEDSIQKEFYNAHLEIKKEIHKHKEQRTGSSGASLKTALNAINRAYEKIKNVTTQLTETSDSRWDEIKNADTISFNYHHLEYASTLTLLRALFHSSPHRLRIPRSNFDNRIPFM